MNATIYVACRGSEVNEQRVRIGRYLYSGWAYKGWGSDPCGKVPGTGFLFEGPDSPGFGADALLGRLASGLYFGHRCPAVPLASDVVAPRNDHGEHPVTLG